ncbi:MAG: DUF1573 domain-containing protein [Paramuribaculum sp.]|nr:DUF1573 domain-containing protein [Paramuribaculum sp.]
MNRSMYILAGVLLCAVSSLSAEVTVNWLNPVHNFGAFKEELGPVTCTFLGVNTGTDSLVVLDARANCGCTRPTYSRKPVAPGDTVEISVSYHPNGRPGRFDKHVRVTTNATDSPATLHVKGTVIGKASTLTSRFPVAVGAMRLNHDVCPLGQTFRGHVLASSVEMYNAGTDSVRPYLSRKPEAFNVVFQPEVIAPGEQGIMSLTAYTARVPEWGLVADSLILVPDGGTAEEHPLTIATTMIITEDFSGLTEEQRANAPLARVNPGKLDFADISRDGGKLTLKFSISNAGKSSLSIRRIYSACDAIKITSAPKSVAPGKSKEVTVTLDPSLLPADADILNERISLITNSPNNSNLTLRVVGRINP